MSIRRDRPPQFESPERPIRPRSPAELLEPTRAPERPKGARVRRESRPMGGFIRLISSVMTGSLMLMTVVGGGFLLLNHQYETAGPLSTTRTIAIPRGEGRLKIASRLEREGVISNRWAFLINHLARSSAGDGSWELKAGEYEFKAGSNMRSVMKMIMAGRSVSYKLTVPEGLTSQQIVARIMKSSDLVGDVAKVPPEGSLLPDTFSFSKGTSRTDLIARIQTEQQRTIDALWAKRAPDLPVASKEEALILASIVEKETGQNDERTKVAAVFINRLRKGMRLQSDPTIIYGIVGGQGALGRPIYRSDIKQNTPYNTYHIKGLPPTPICNPGRASIAAVLNPAESDDLYFVADGTGGHLFSKTLKEHNAAVANWRKIEKVARAKAKAAEASKASKEAGAVAAQETGTVSTAIDVAAASAVAGKVAAGAGAVEGSGAPAKAATVSVRVPLPIRKPR